MKSIFSHRPFWAKRLLPSPVLPMSREEMDQLGWDSCDIILVTGDAYVDHPSFGMAVIGRVLEEHGFRVGIIAQPAWDSAEPYRELGRPNLFFGITAGNMDSMVNHYTSDRRPRSDDAYTPDGKGGLRPDRSVIVYSQRVHEAYQDAPIVIGGIEASLRRLAHYDYWSDKVRRSILLDARADILLYGNAERAIIELAHRLAQSESIHSIRDLRGTAFILKQVPSEYRVLDKSVLEEQSVQINGRSSRRDSVTEVVRLPSYEEVRDDPLYYAHASRAFHHETNPGNARPLVQKHGNRELWINPPPIPLSTPDLDHIFALPYTRTPHPNYGNAKIPAYEMIRFSINIMRGCFGGCTFCSITEHEGRIIQSRSEESILQEVDAIRDQTPGFTGTISDLGGPTANMYRLACKDKKIESNCRRLSCIHPEICPQLQTDHKPLIQLYKKARQREGVKRILIASGLRYDLALRSNEYIQELVTHHVGGYLKIAPEHTDPDVLDLMMKPKIGLYEQFAERFYHYSKAAGKEQYLIPYFISAHPGSDLEKMLELALWLKRHQLRLDQVQNFLPSPMAIATTIYHSQINPLRRVNSTSTKIAVAKGDRERREQKALLRYHDRVNWELIRSVLIKLGRQDLIGRGKNHLVPPSQDRLSGRNDRVKPTVDRVRKPVNRLKKSSNRRRRK